MLAIGTTGATFTAAVAVTPLPALAQHRPQVSTALETAMILIAGFIGLVSWGRCRLRYRSSPAQGPTATRANTEPTSRWLHGFAPAAVLAAAVTGALTGADMLGGSPLPRPNSVNIVTAAFGRWPVFECLELASALVFSFAAWGFARRADAAADRFLAWAGLACTLWALSDVNYAIFPSGTNGWLYTGDYFRLAGVLAWAAAACLNVSGFQAEITSRARVEERRRVARDLHDGLAQDLAYLNSRARLLVAAKAPDRASLSDIAAISERALQESRRALLTLAPEVPGPLDEDLVRTAREAVYDYPTQVHVSVPPGLAVDPERHETMLRIVREAVHNASRHGSAASAAVEVKPSGRGLALRVHDDGSGFDPATTLKQPGATPLETGFGLLGMEERSRVAGARFKLSSALGRGTTIEVVWP